VIDVSDFVRAAVVGFPRDRGPVWNVAADYAVERGDDPTSRVLRWVGRRKKCPRVSAAYHWDWGRDPVVRMDGPWDRCPPDVRDEWLRLGTARVMRKFDGSRRGEQR
jgi:hypothetical protein